MEVDPLGRHGLAIDVFDQDENAAAELQVRVKGQRAVRRDLDVGEDRELPLERLDRSKMWNLTHPWKARLTVAIASC